MKYSVLLLAIAMMLQSCTKSNLEDETNEILIEETNDELLALAANPQTAMLIEDQTKSGNDRKKFKHPCSLRAERLEYTDLPAKITDYIQSLTDENIYTVFILKISKSSDHYRYSVRLNSGLHAHFDSDGNLKRQITKNKRFEAIRFDKLPLDAQTYLTDKINLESIIGILKVTKMDDSVRFVARLRDNSRIRFDAEGNLLNIIK